MGGLGSGRWGGSSNKTTIEQVKRIDIRYLRKMGVLGSHSNGSLSWSINEKPNGQVDFVCYPTQIQLSYNFRRSPSKTWESVEQTIQLVETGCHYGGTRYWFQCPGCMRRVVILCGHDKYFLCRHCYQLSYTSQQQTAFDRLMTKKHKIGECIFADYVSGHGHLKKKGMHWSKFERLEKQFKALEYRLLVDTDRLIYKLRSRF